MKVTVRTLKDVSFQIEVSPADKVSPPAARSRSASPICRFYE
jgi:hypothetical protein